MKIWDDVMDLGKECSAGLSSMRWKEIQQVITVSSSEYTNTNRIQLCYSVPYGRLQWVFTVKETCQKHTTGSTTDRTSLDHQRTHSGYTSDYIYITTLMVTVLHQFCHTTSRTWTQAGLKGESWFLFYLNSSSLNCWPSEADQSEDSNRSENGRSDQ